MTISVVIPTWNEAAELPETLHRLRAVPEVNEVVVSDAGSTDTTTAVATSFGARIVTGSRGRGGQMRRGAAAVTGDVVWFVHADTWVPVESGRAILGLLHDPGVVGGACYKEFRDPPWLTWGSRWRCGVRMRWSQFAYGDQAIFARREALEAAAGVPDVPLMEEYGLCANLRRLGRLALVPVTVTTSARRLRQVGVLRAYGRMAWINLRFRFGASPEALQKNYERE
ncbi:MAG TPA: TIGR04283 family arsenosugar biosynthesis glycosyltransferase [Verrucomicrobiota bacterium]|nr:TIGR04283 family arsenosugar biosynthesis glycosyltransferase [Verrucomicrobiota bacterium]